MKDVYKGVEKKQQLMSEVIIVPTGENNMFTMSKVSLLNVVIFSIFFSIFNFPRLEMLFALQVLVKGQDITQQDIG